MNNSGLGILDNEDTELDLTKVKQKKNFLFSVRKCIEKSILKFWKIFLSRTSKW